jgi:hypothetical protein
VEVLKPVVMAGRQERVDEIAHNNKALEEKVSQMVKKPNLPMILYSY